ncbi:NAD-binding protein, partial [Salmonella enterica subsp. enterica serovar Anatum]|nr:NAD-binding protein [Salmonella enterica subsp. enterica serovar Anatum]
AEYAFGKSGNFMANYTYGVSLLIANVAIAISAVGYGTELFGAGLARRLEKDYSVKLIERDQQRAAELAEKLQNTIVFFGDAS